MIVSSKYVVCSVNCQKNGCFLRRFQGKLVYGIYAFLTEVRFLFKNVPTLSFKVSCFFFLGILIILISIFILGVTLWLEVCFKIGDLLDHQGRISRSFFFLLVMVSDRCRCEICIVISDMFL